MPKNNNIENALNDYFADVKAPQPTTQEVNKLRIKEVKKPDKRRVKGVLLSSRARLALEYLPVLLQGRNIKLHEYEVVEQGIELVAKKYGVNIDELLKTLTPD